MKAMCSALLAASSMQRFPVLPLHFSLRLSLTVEINGVFTLLPPKSPKECYNGLTPANAQVSTPKKYRNCHLVLGSRWAERLRGTGKEGSGEEQKQ